MFSSPGSLQNMKMSFRALLCDLYLHRVSDLVPSTPQGTSSALGSSSLQRGSWSTRAQWVWRWWFGFWEAASRPWARSATLSWASPSPNLEETTPT